MAVRGIIGKKIGMTCVFNEDGRMIPVTVLECGPSLTAPPVKVVECSLGLTPRFLKKAIL